MPPRPRAHEPDAWDTDHPCRVSTAWSLEHSQLYTLIWSVVAVFAPLAAAQYRRAASR